MVAVLLIWNYVDVCHAASKWNATEPKVGASESEKVVVCDISAEKFSHIALTNNRNKPEMSKLCKSLHQGLQEAYD